MTTYIKLDVASNVASRKTPNRMRKAGNLQTKGTQCVQCAPSLSFHISLSVQIRKFNPSATRLQCTVNVDELSNKGLWMTTMNGTENNTNECTRSTSNKNTEGKQNKIFTSANGHMTAEHRGICCNMSALASNFAKCYFYSNSILLSPDFYRNAVKINASRALPSLFLLWKDSV